MTTCTLSFREIYNELLPKPHCFYCFSLSFIHTVFQSKWLSK